MAIHIPQLHMLKWKKTTHLARNCSDADNLRSVSPRFVISVAESFPHVAIWFFGVDLVQAFSSIRRAVVRLSRHSGQSMQGDLN